MICAGNAIYSRKWASWSLKTSCFQHFATHLPENRSIKWWELRFHQKTKWKLIFVKKEIPKAIHHNYYWHKMEIISQASLVANCNIYKRFSGVFSASKCLYVEHTMYKSSLSFSFWKSTFQALSLAFTNDEPAYTRWQIAAAKLNGISHRLACLIRFLAQKYRDIAWSKLPRSNINSVHLNIHSIPRRNIQKRTLYEWIWLICGHNLNSHFKLRAFEK